MNINHFKLRENRNTKKNMLRVIMKQIFIYTRGTKLAVLWFYLAVSSCLKEYNLWYHQSPDEIFCQCEAITPSQH